MKNGHFPICCLFLDVQLATEGAASLSGSLMCVVRGASSTLHTIRARQLRAGVRYGSSDDRILHCWCFDRSQMGANGCQRLSHPEEDPSLPLSEASKFL